MITVDVLAWVKLAVEVLKTLEADWLALPVIEGERLVDEWRDRDSDDALVTEEFGFDLLALRLEEEPRVDELTSEGNLESEVGSVLEAADDSVEETDFCSITLRDEAAEENLEAPEEADNDGVWDEVPLERAGVFMDLLLERDSVPELDFESFSKLLLDDNQFEVGLLRGISEELEA